MTRRKVQYFVTARALEKTSPCREEGCAAPLVFLRLDSGRTMVLDARSKEPAEGGWNLEPHWGRCPGADKFRRTRPLT